MHKLAKKMADCLKAKVEGMGIDNIEGAALEELGEWVDILKDMAEYDKNMRIIEAMDETEDSEKSMKYIEEYEDYPEDDRRGYRGQPRDSMGRYMGRRRGGRRMGFEEPPYYHMTPDMYHDWDNMTEEERERDLDRHTLNRMYYTEPIRMPNIPNAPMKDESRYERARRGYEEKKTTGADKQEKMKSLEEYMKELGSDLSAMLTDMSPEEKTMVKSKLSMLASKVS